MTSLIYVHEKVTPSQMRAGRALVAWSQKELALNAKVGSSTVADFERGERTPVPNNAEAMREALESVGVRFYGGGVVFEGSNLSPEATPFRSGSPIRWIDATDLSNWSDRRDGQAGIPELLTRLILTGHRNARLRFPSGDSIQYPGWDGICEVDQSTDLVPVGQSAWEIGVQRQGMSGKADSEYEKRTRSPDGVELSRATFIFVTSRRWPGKRKWADARRAEGHWAEVQALDGDDLVHWIDVYPTVALWLAARIGKRPPGLRQLPELWTEWSFATRRPLTAELTLAGRDEECATVLKWLRAQSSLISIQAESVEESLAFLHAAIMELPPRYAEAYISRTIVPDTDEAARRIGESMSSMVIALSSTAPGLAQTLAAKGHHVYLALGSDAITPTDVMRLSRPRRVQLEYGLRALGFDEAEAQRLAVDSGRSLTVLRRLMPSAPSQIPKWARPPIMRALVSAVLAGAWSGDAEGDRNALEVLAGQVYEGIERDLVPLATALDGPFRKSEGMWKVASPRDAFFLIAEYLTRLDIERFIDLFCMVLKTPDPRFKLDDESRWIASVQGVRSTHSSMLRRGLTETAILLAIFGDSACHVGSASAMIDRAVRSLFVDADAERWWSLSSDFQRLAEAAPEVFLGALENALAISPTPLLALFAEEKNPVFGGEHLSDLMWAMERLAWNVALLARVSGILADLAAVDPGGRWGNRPASTLRRIFLIWSPQTNATLDERFIVIDRLRQSNPEQAWTLLIGIAPKMHDMSSPGAHLQWRDFSVGQTEEVTYGLMSEGIQNVAIRLIEDVGTNETRWRQLLELLSNFDAGQRAAIRNRLLHTLPKITDASARNNLRTVIRGILHRHRLCPDAKWAMSEEELAEVQSAYDQLEPVRPVESVAWLFAEHPALPRPSDDPSQALPSLEELQAQAVDFLVEQGGADLVFELARCTTWAGHVGRAVIDSALSPADQDAMLVRGVRADDQNECALAHGIIVRGTVKWGPIWSARLLRRANEEGWGERALNRILMAMPPNRETWDAGAGLGSAVEDAYWREVGAMWIQGEKENIVYAAERLLAVGRARHTVSLLSGHLNQGLPSELLIRALREAVHPRYSEGEGSDSEPAVFSYEIAEILNWLDGDPVADRRDIVQLDWAYFHVLRHSQRPAKTLQQGLASDPVFFVELLKIVYEPKEGTADRRDPHEDPKEIVAVAVQAWKVLNDWNHVPGSDESGVIDGDALEAWVKQVRILCANSGYAEIGDERIGNILAAAKSDNDALWPPEPVREVIEFTRSKGLETGFCLGVFNLRGITTRMPEDGGAQERELAARYRKWARAIALEWPRTGTLLERIARSYDEDAKREDQQAERQGWL